MAAPVCNAGALRECVCAGLRPSGVATTMPPFTGSDIMHRGDTGHADDYA